MAESANLKRWQLFELEDQAWCPRLIRDGITDVLAFSLTHGNAYEAALPWLLQALRECGTDRIVDLCSGGGGPWPILLPQLNGIRATPVTVCLTDRYPNLEAFASAAAESGGQLVFHASAVDATAVPEELRGMLTLFTSLHHFRPSDVVAVLRNAASQRRGICIFEVTHRSWRELFLSMFVPLLTFLITPSLRPFRWSRIVLTYLLPVIPAALLFDGLVSCLRTYRPDELLELVPDRQFPDYHWFTGELPTRRPTPLTYLVGYPKGGSRQGGDAFG